MTTFNAFYKVAAIKEGNVALEIETTSLTTAKEIFKEYEAKYREYQNFLRKVNDYVAPYYIEFWVINNDNRDDSLRIKCTRI